MVRAVLEEMASDSSLFDSVMRANAYRTPTPDELRNYDFLAKDALEFLLADVPPLDTTRGGIP